MLSVDDCQSTKVPKLLPLTLNATAEFVQVTVPPVATAVPVLTVVTLTLVVAVEVQLLLVPLTV